ncbi:LydA-like holin [uncultured Caudovirales phage]|uniref:LydA-like holin n=1 Tax=uncultured Caudovirales phage TaxID=2100421 RepID=A0A6J5M4R0_9CAUD|nr:LydA-like holin [uncultured Caudovirales phage]
MSDFDAASAAGAGALGLLGRALHLARTDRRPLGWSLLWELPVAIGMGIVGKGIADYFGLDGFPEYAVTISIAYVGPRVIDLAISEVERRAKGRG